MSAIAVIDVGSNSIKVAVVDAISRAELGRQTESVRLQQADGDEGLFPAEVQNEAVEAIVRLVAFARGKGAEQIVILGTSAIRESASRQAFARRVKTATDIPLTIVSGEVEARLAIAGVRTDPAYQAYTNILSFDLGGGSLEVCALRGPNCILARSFRIGSVRLTHGYLRGGLGVVDDLDQSSIRTHLLGALTTVIPSAAAENYLIVGAGGAFAAIALYLEAIGETPAGGRLPVLRIRELKDRLCALTSDERKKVPGIPADRADIMPAALITLCVLADLTGAEAFHLSHRGVRHGMVELMLSQSGKLL
jgi:exopolyphosphatase/guanosine-5'-triphosphate,3'-diphosphate pyrophosphatase